MKDNLSQKPNNQFDHENSHEIDALHKMDTDSPHSQKGWPKKNDARLPEGSDAVDEMILTINEIGSRLDEASCGCGDEKPEKDK